MKSLPPAFHALPKRIGYRIRSRLLHSIGIGWWSRPKERNVWCPLVGLNLGQ
jgi:hypothetical protein